jgi:hypothetical protein
MIQYTKDLQIAAVATEADSIVVLAVDVILGQRGVGK